MGTNCTDNRLQWLDIAKGFTIILMVLGHTSIPKFASDFIWSFHMPLFFIASGWCTNWDRDNICKFIAFKASALLLPFVLYSSIVLIASQLIGGGNLKTFLCIGWEGYALWFIPVLFFALIVAKLIKSVQAKNLQILFWLLTAVIGDGLSYNKIYLPWTFSTVPYACFLIILGSKAKQYQEYFSSPRWWLLIVGFLTAAIVSRFCRLDMASNSITPITVLTVGGCAGTAMMFTFSSYIDKYAKYTSRLLQAVGKETYLILAFSQITIVLLNHYFVLNSAIKYAFLIAVLVVLKYMKAGLNVLIGKRFCK